MTTAEFQNSGRVDDLLRMHTSPSDESTNAQPLAQRPTISSTSSVVEKQRLRATRIPPPAPSPPSHSSHRSPPPASHPQIEPFQPGNMADNEMDSQSQWLFAEDEIRNSPSILDGLSVAEESCRRAKGINFIIQAGILLKIPQLTLGTAAVFFHRFYMRYSMVAEKGGIHHYNIAATALFLATKAEENCRKTKEIVIAVVKVAQKNASLIIDEQSKEFWRWKDSILLYEETMLELLTFDVVLESPYTCLYNFLKQLQVESNKNMRNVAWAFLNDSCMTTLCLLMPPRDIAIASIYFAAKFNNERIPDENGVPWWALLKGVPEKITKAIDVMAEFYTENPLKKSDNPYDRSPGSSAEDLERTRLRMDSRSPIFEPQMDKMDVNGDEVNWGGADSKVDERSIKTDGGEGGKYNISAGDDDTRLKAVANDPATHEGPGGNGMLNGFLDVKSDDGKRKSPAPAERSGAKRAKTENEQDESEEGEVEE